MLEDNHNARAFYEALRGSPDGRRPQRIAGAPAPVVAYLWRDVGALIDGAP